MKKLLLIVFMVVVSLFLLVMTSSCLTYIPASLGEEFTLPVDHTVEINNEGLVIQFVEVLTDSRCPRYAECIWEGEAKCLMYIHLGQSVSSIEFTQPGAGVAKEVFNKYLITFTLEPYPEIGKDIAPSDYKMTMTVTE